MSLEAMRNYASRLESSKVGYDQGERWSFNPKRDGSVVIPNQECDCSSSTAAIIRAGGYKLDTRDPIYTANFKQKAVAAGFQAISISGKSLSQIVGMTMSGDSILGPGHIVFAYNPTKWWSAENDEYRRARGGREGDQTGFEARFRSPYMRSRGWQWILRPPGLSAPAKPSTGISPRPTSPIEGVKPRSVIWNDPPKDLVKVVQEIAGAAADGVRGPSTIAAVKRLQTRLGIPADGLFGPGSAEKYLLSVSNLYKGRGGMPSAAVKLVQWIVRSRVDGQFGDLTVADVKSAQVWAGLTPDGNVGDETKKRITI